MAGERTDVDAIGVQSDVAQSGQMLQTDQVLGREQALFEEVDQRGTT